MAKELTSREKRCEDCTCLIEKNRIMCCDELWGRPCNDIGADECPEEITMEEVDEITEKTKGMKIDHGAKADSGTEKKKKVKVVKVSDEKQTLFSTIWECLAENYGENAEIVKENKLITVNIGGKHFKIDLIEQRPPKTK